jgi:hypothetical protein
MWLGGEERGLSRNIGCATSCRTPSFFRNIP